MSLKDSVDEVLRKIGRNIMLFQELEHLLKFIVVNGELSGFSRDLEKIKAARVKNISKQTMGTLVGQYIENTNLDSEAISSELEVIDDAYLSFRFHFECDATSYEAKKVRLANLVSDRNKLVHHLLPRFDSNSVDSCRIIGDELDEQSEKVRQEIKDLKAKVKALDRAKNLLASFLDSEEGKKIMEHSYLVNTPLVIMLGEIAVQMQRADGWTLINTAGQLLKQHLPEEVAVLKENYGHKSLKSLILATEIFDMHEETTDKGGTRVLYRLKSGWELSLAKPADEQIILTSKLISNSGD